MATPFSLNKITPSLLLLFSMASSLVIFLVTLFGIIQLTNQQNKEIISYDFKLILQGNSDLIKQKRFREFSQKTLVPDDNYFLEISDSTEFSKFTSGNADLIENGQCIKELYYEYDLKFCSKKTIPWSFLKIALSMYFAIILVMVLIFRHLNGNLILSFVKLFKIANIPYSENLNFAKAWRTAFEMAELFQKYKRELIEVEQHKVFSLITKQVAHDIRSPLTALSMATQGLNEIPEEKRLLIRHSVQRINDIANDLLMKGKRQTNPKVTAKENLATGNKCTAPESFTHEKQRSVILLPALIDSIVSEKRIQFRDKIKTQIEADLNGAFGTFAEINSTEFARIISNLVNNSVESFADNIGKVMITANQHRGDIRIIVSDNGKGIPEIILKKLGQAGVTHGKENTQSGSGLGIFHAKSTIQSWNGQFEISSKSGAGTSIQITLPSSIQPSWFASEIKIFKNSTIVTLDDDISIHQVWKSRLESLLVTENNVDIVSLTSTEDFINLAPTLKNKNSVFLIDYEFLGQKYNGIELIKKLNISEESFLITSHYDDSHIQNEAANLRFKILPKQLAGLAPIRLVADANAPTSHSEGMAFDYILIDDDPLVHMSWKLNAEMHAHQIKYYFSPEEFKVENFSIKKSTFIYLDSNLGVRSDGTRIKGEDFAKELFELGFKNIILTTGYDSDEFKDLDFLVDVVGKDPPTFK